MVNPLAVRTRPEPFPMENETVQRNFTIVRRCLLIGDSEARDFRSIEVITIKSIAHLFDPRPGLESPSIERTETSQCLIAATVALSLFHFIGADCPDGRPAWRNSGTSVRLINPLATDSRFAKATNHSHRLPSPSVKFDGSNYGWTKRQTRRFYCFL